MPRSTTVIRAEAAAMDAEDYDAVAEAHHKLDELNGYDASARAGRLLHGLGFPAETHSRAGVVVLRRLARAPEPGPRADDAVGPAAARRADQPSRPGRGAVARAMAAEVSRHADADLARPRIPRRRVHPHAAPARRQGQALHRRLHQLRAPARRAPAPAADHPREGCRPSARTCRSFIDRFKAKASKAKQAQSRVKRLAKLAGTEAVRAERALHINFAEPAEAAALADPPEPRGRRLSRARRARRRAVAATSRSCTTSASAWRRATASACSGRTAPASRRW